MDDERKRFISDILDAILDDVRSVKVLLKLLHDHEDTLVQRLDSLNEHVQKGTRGEHLIYLNGYYSYEEVADILTEF